MEGTEKKEEVFSKVIRAGKRTYFFDVKSTRRNDYYLTITESKKRFDENGDIHFEKHKIFLYQEDFDKFMEGLTDALTFIDTEGEITEFDRESDSVDVVDEVVNEVVQEPAVVGFDDVDFEDLK
jgi:hypothetical protein